jgi:hypothetical protein
MDDEIRKVHDELRRAIAAGDADGVEDSIRQLEFVIVEDGSWRTSLFELVKELLCDRRLLSIPTSSLVARLIAENWDALSATQRGELRPLLSDAFEHFGDVTGVLVVAEVYADRYADEDAFSTLDRLSESGATTPARALAAYGLGRLARRLGTGPLYARVVARLTVLAESPILDIRNEARSALAKARN